MKTLKEELQEIVDEDKLNNNSWFICLHLSSCNKIEFKEYRNMALNYAKYYVTEDDYVWWHMKTEDISEKYRLINDYVWWDITTEVISEKYRFIKDLIAIL